jgi:hypothetical protein|tara:strand:- start:804 stop:1430 length:627 start_codon:yes stop_codon:yes gene_type:complete
MSYSKEYIPANVLKKIETTWKSELQHQWKQKARWSDIYRSIDPHIPTNSTILDLGAGDEHVKSLNKHNGQYLSIDLNNKCTFQEDLDYNFLDLSLHRGYDPELNQRVPGDLPWDIGLMVEVMEYLYDPVAVIEHYKQYATTWIITTRIGRPNHIYETTHPLQNRYSHWKDFETTLKKHFSDVTVHTIDTTLVTCTGRMKPFAMALCEV